MTFIAQPYEQFVDDLLTSLTGGMIREEHRFTEEQELYRLASPGARALSIKVFGQHNEAFIVFEGGRDYQFDSKEEAIQWIDKGRYPDDHSYFYINYYVDGMQPRLSDRNPGSVTSILSQAFARELAVLHKQMEMIYQSGFVDLATGSSLDHVVSLLGLSRKDAKFATGEVLFKRSTPAEGDISIPVGTLVSTNEGGNFETSAQRTLRKGQLSITIPIRAREAGPPGRVESNTIININRPIFGIEAVVNERPTFFASERETDQALRLRVKGCLERAGRATVNAIKYGLIEAIPEINEGNIQVSEDPVVAGKVEVKFGIEAPANERLLQRIDKAIFQTRPAGVRVMHNLSLYSATPAGVKTESGPAGPKAKSPLKQIPPDALAQMPEGILSLQADVALHLTESNLSAVQKETIADNVRSVIAGYIDELPMGAVLVYNKLLGRVMAFDDVADARLKLKINSSLNENFTSNIDTSGRKAVIDPANISIGLMEEIVKIRIMVTLEPAPGTTVQHVPRALQDTLRDAVIRELSDAGSSLELEHLKSALQVELSNGSGFQLAAETPLVLNAEYEETGRLLNRTDTVDLSANQVPVLEPLDINLLGDFDA